MSTVTCALCHKQMYSSDYPSHREFWHALPLVPRAAPAAPAAPAHSLAAHEARVTPRFFMYPELTIPAKDRLALAAAVVPLLQATEALHKEYEQETNRASEVRWHQLANAEARQLRKVITLLREPTFRWKMYSIAVSEVCRAAPDDRETLYTAHHTWLRHARPFGQFLDALSLLSEATTRADTARELMENSFGTDTEKSPSTS